MLGQEEFISWIVIAFNNLEHDGVILYKFENVSEIWEFELAQVDEQVPEFYQPTSMDDVLTNNGAFQILMDYWHTKYFS